MKPADARAGQPESKDAAQKYFDCACGKPSTSSCGGCRTERYCSAECQKRFWPEHKPDCKAMSLVEKCSNGRCLFCKFRKPSLAACVVCGRERPLCFLVRWTACKHPTCPGDHFAQHQQSCTGPTTPDTSPLEPPSGSVAVRVAGLIRPPRDCTLRAGDSLVWKLRSIAQEAPDESMPDANPFPGLVQRTVFPSITLLGFAEPTEERKSAPVRLDRRLSPRQEVQQTSTPTTAASTEQRAREYCNDPSCQLCRPREDCIAQHRVCQLCKTDRPECLMRQAWCDHWTCKGEHYDKHIDQCPGMLRGIDLPLSDSDIARGTVLEESMFISQHLYTDRVFPVSAGAPPAAAAGAETLASPSHARLHDSHASLAGALRIGAPCKDCLASQEPWRCTHTIAPRGEAQTQPAEAPKPSDAPPIKCECGKTLIPQLLAKVTGPDGKERLACSPECFHKAESAGAPAHQAPLCSICIDRPVNTALVPCGHCYCAECLAVIIESRKSCCSLCRVRFRDTLRLYL